MSLVHKLRHLLDEPPPEFAFEFSESGIAWARYSGKEQATGFEPLEPGVLEASPIRDNVLRPDKLEETVMRLVPALTNRRRRGCAVVLPDYCGRVAVLDFDSFPSEPAEQLSLVRFRVKKSVPFDLDAAAVSYHVQPHAAGGKKRDVVVSVVALEILARYEAPLRMAGLHPGLVTISALTALNLVEPQELDVIAKLSGKAISVAVTENNSLRMFRCVEMAAVTFEELLGVLFPTYAYIEDEYKKKPSRLLLCGFGQFGESIAEALGSELQSRIEPLRSRYGTPLPVNAGLLGYLAGLGLPAEGAAA